MLKNVVIVGCEPVFAVIQELSRYPINSPIVTQLLKPKLTGILNKIKKDIWEKYPRKQIFFQTTKRNYGYTNGYGYAKEEPPLAKAIAKLTTLMGDFDFIVSHPVIPFVEYHLGLETTKPYPIDKKLEMEKKEHELLTSRGERNLANPDYFDYEVEMGDGVFKATFYPYNQLMYKDLCGGVEYSQFVEFFDGVRCAMRDLDIFNLTPEEVDLRLSSEFNAPVGFVKASLVKKKSRCSVNGIETPIWWFTDNVLFITCDIHQLRSTKIE